MKLDPNWLIAAYVVGAAIIMLVGGFLEEKHCTYKIDYFGGYVIAAVVWPLAILAALALAAWWLLALPFRIVYAAGRRAAALF